MVKYAPRKVYIRESGGYVELSYTEFCRCRESDQTYTLVLDYYHPAVHYPNRVNYYALMAICDVARKKYGTPVWSEQNEKY